MNIVLLTHFGASSTGIGALGFSGQAFLIQLITFVLAYLVLRRYAFGPILDVMRRRRETIEHSVKLAEQLKNEQIELDKKVEKELHKARQEADAIISSAQDSGRQAIHEAEDKARDKAAGILKEAESRLVQDTARARKQLEGELVGLISDVTEAVIDEKVDAKKDAALIERALKERQTA
ncbi:MAG TPA: F0F1 ATP synthase subunit B [Verrucomicrobiae bacterium]|jgi:F-type H+-transporting ATPase subunit b|nr:F0F1 ATP synthase subunit B [Verrucomicrobiae bacterium]